MQAMADITLCTNDTCKARAKCLRYQAEPGPMQSYQYFGSMDGYLCVFFLLDKSTDDA